MDLIDVEEFYALIEKQNTIDNKIINFSTIDLRYSENITFHNCNFIGNLTIFDSETPESMNETKFTTFENCNFNNCSLVKCNVNLIIIKNSIFINNFSIKNSIFFGIRIEDNIDINCQFRITSSIFKSSFWFSNNIFKDKGKMSFFENTFTEQVFFIENTLRNLIFVKNTFSSLTVFSSNNFNNFSTFDNCNFEHFDFLNSKIQSVKFRNCNFLSLANFNDLERIEISKLNFINCEFNRLTSFNYSKIDVLELDKCTFEKKASFDPITVNSLKINQVTFLQGAYFDDIQIKKINDCDRKTIRTIKQELQKAENRIDFNRFRNYELIAHYKELSFKNNFKDKFILGATKLSSNFGSWIWAFWFTILSGLFWYSILYRIENSGVFNSEKVNEFFVGAFRFFLVTDFFNPLENDRTYLENGWSWLIFILGKIFIAFGIYEMIQSFRKFKA